MNKTTKLSLLAVIIVLVGVAAFYQMNRQGFGMNPNKENAVDISTSVEKDLSQIDSDSFSNDFKDIDKDISGL